MTKAKKPEAASNENLKPQTPGGDGGEGESGPALVVQEPGSIAGVESNKLEAIAAGTVGDLAEALDSLDDDELGLLAVLEKQGQARTTALGAITREQQRRNVAAIDPADAETNEKAPLGDPTTYARMRGKDVDPKTLERPVLTLDGWVLPLPKAEALG